MRANGSHAVTGWNVLSAICQQHSLSRHACYPLRYLQHYRTMPPILCCYSYPGVAALYHNLPFITRTFPMHVPLAQHAYTPPSTRFSETPVSAGERVTPTGILYRSVLLHLHPLLFFTSTTSDRTQNTNVAQDLLTIEPMLRVTTLFLRALQTHLKSQKG